MEYSNTFVETEYFRRFFFINIKTNKNYDIDFKYYTNLNAIHRGIKMMFDLHKLPPGEYFVNFEYKRRIYNTKYKIVIIKAKRLEISELYYDYNDNENDLVE